MITRVQVKNFRNLADIDVQLSPLTVLVGRNGTGKSTFLDVLRFVRDALHLGVDTAIDQRGGIGALRRGSPDGGTNDIEISLDIEEPDGITRYSFLIAAGQEEKQRVKHELLEIENSSGTWTNFFETRDGKWISVPSSYFMPQGVASATPTAVNALVLPSLYNYTAGAYSVLKNVIGASFYSVFPNTLRLPQRQTNESGLLEEGQNLAIVLRNIKKRGQFYSDLVTSLGRVSQGVCDIRVTEAAGYLVTELGYEAQNGHISWFPLAQESDGTLRVLALLAALYQDASRSLIAIEEPELSIHPGALAVLSEVIQEAATRSQIIITTQSPDLISRFSADQIRVVERVGTETRIGPIDEGQREAINNQLFSAGDLLRIEGLHVSPQEENVPTYA